MEVTCYRGKWPQKLVMAYLLTTAGDRYTSLVAITLISTQKVKGYSPSAALALRWVNKMSIASLMTSHSASNSTTHSTQSNLNPAAISFLRVEELRKICYCCWHLYCTYWRNLTKCGLHLFNQDTYWEHRTLTL